MAAKPMTGEAFFVLTALADGPRHGYGVVGAVADLSHGRARPKAGSLNGVLERLAADGRPASVLASVLAAAVMVVVAGCSHIAPIGPQAGPSMPPARQLGSPITVQVMRSMPPAPTGQCPADAVTLFGSQPNVLRASVIGSEPAPVRSPPAEGSTAAPAPKQTRPAGPPAGVACYRPVGAPVTITSAAVSSVTTSRSQPGPAWYVFVVAFPAADVAAVTALIQRAYDSGDALGMSVGGKLWQAPQPRHKFMALRGQQVNLLSRTQALQLYRLLVPSG